MIELQLIETSDANTRDELYIDQNLALIELNSFLAINKDYISVYLIMVGI